MENENIKTWKAHSIISLAEEDMEAYLMLWPSAEEENATVEEIVEFLREKQIVYGIQEEEIELMLLQKKYLEEVCVARGDSAVPGKDGEFEFFIEVQRERHPKIREDGSVDYSDYDAVTVVKKNQLLVRYHPATAGTGGTNVKGLELPGKRVRRSL